MDYQIDESDEILQEYIGKYRLDDGLPRGHRKQALFLIGCLRKLRRLDFPDRKQAEAAHAKASRWLAECRVFHQDEHAGYNELLDTLSASLDAVGRHIEEKFPDPSS